MLTTGTIFEGSAARTAEELDEAIIGLAVASGFHADVVGVDVDVLRWTADAAVEYLNDNVAPEGTFFVVDDGLVLVADGDPF